MEEKVQTMMLCRVRQSKVNNNMEKAVPAARVQQNLPAMLHLRVQALRLQAPLGLMRMLTLPGTPCRSLQSLANPGPVVLQLDLLSRLHFIGGNFFSNGGLLGLRIIGVYAAHIMIDWASARARNDVHVPFGCRPALARTIRQASMLFTYRSIGLWLLLKMMWTVRA